MKWINVERIVTVEVFDEEHEDYIRKRMTVEDILDKFTDEGCPTIYSNPDDVEPVVRCKDCANWNSETHGCLRNQSVSPWWENDFCSYGERANGEQDG